MEYPNKGLTHEASDLLALRIAAEHRVEEVSAMSLRWWDYRTMHPTEATYLFAEHYRLACQTWYTRWVDETSAPDARAFTPDDIFASVDMTAMWLARQSADKLGVPYDFVMEFALNRGFVRGFPKMMRPNQFYGEDFELDIGQGWGDRCQITLRQPRSALYKAQNYEGKKWQRLYRAWLTLQVRARPAPQHRLVARLLSEGTIDEAWVITEFGEPLMQAARQYQRLLQ